MAGEFFTLKESQNPDDPLKRIKTLRDCSLLVFSTCGSVIYCVTAIMMWQ